MGIILFLVILFCGPAIILIGRNPSYYRGYTHRHAKHEEESARNPKPIEEDQARAHEYHHREDEKKFWKRSIYWSVATLIIAVSALVVAWLTFDDAHRALIAVQRAFVFVKQKDDAFVPSQQGAFTVWEGGNVWENAGATSTVDLTFQIICAQSVPPVSDPYLIKTDEKTANRVVFGTQFGDVLGPHQSTWGGACRFPKEIVSMAQKGSIHIYIISVARYNDIFDGTKRHITERCSEINDIRGNPENFSSALTYNSLTCDTHNCADEQCRKE